MKGILLELGKVDNIDDYGWVKDDNDSILFWVPSQYRNGILKDYSLFTLPTHAEGRPVKMDFSGFCHGNEWTKTWKE